MTDMNPQIILKGAVPAILLAPVAVPIVQGLCGIAVVGLPLFAVGTLVAKTVGALSPPSKSSPLEADSSLL
ncbi:MAG: hypothetical protein FDX18_10345 [Chlorobium sp.]|nr:MAG: hypothetical protein FDX18_10345 [Chlorobium sp.]